MLKKFPQPSEHKKEIIIKDYYLMNLMMAFLLSFVLFCIPFTFLLQVFVNIFGYIYCEHLEIYIINKFPEFNISTKLYQILLELSAGLASFLVIYVVYFFVKYLFSNQKNKKNISMFDKIKKRSADKALSDFIDEFCDYKKLFYLVEHNVNNFSKCVRNRSYKNYVNAHNNVIKHLSKLKKSNYRFYEDLAPPVKEIFSIYKNAVNNVEMDVKSASIDQPDIFFLFEKLREKYRKKNFYDSYDLYHKLEAKIYKLKRAKQRTGFDFTYIFKELNNNLLSIRESVLSNNEAAMLWEKRRHNEEMEYWAEEEAEEARKANEISSELARIQASSAKAQTIKTAATVYGAWQLRKMNKK